MAGHVVEASRQGKSTYRAPKDLIARHAGVSVRTLTVANAELAAAGLILIEPHFDAARKQHDVSAWCAAFASFAWRSTSIRRPNPCHGVAEPEGKSFREFGSVRRMGCFVASGWRFFPGGARTRGQMSHTLGNTLAQRVRHFLPAPQASGDVRAAPARERPYFT
jgi:hypothetical protein